MAIEREDVFRAARLIQWGLQPRIKPVQSNEYMELVREYLNRGEFREVVEEMSDGIGLYVLDVSEHGIILSPREDSVFMLKVADFRPSSGRAEDRLLDGLVQVTIASTVFPRARDLEEDMNRPRPPVTIDEIEDDLRALCTALAERSKSEPDPLSDDVKSGIYDAWRVYDQRYAIKDTKDSRQVRGSTRRIIEFNLNKLKEYGCFTETKVSGKDAWQPTRRYNVLVQELAASRLFEEVHRILNPENKLERDDISDTDYAEDANYGENADENDDANNDEEALFDGDFEEGDE